MSVINLTQWQSKPGRGAETLANAAAAKRIFERLGAQVRAYQPLVAGPNTSNFLAFVTEFDTMSSYATFVRKVQANEEWRLLSQHAVMSAEPSATMVNSTLSVTIPGLERAGPAAKGDGPRVVVATTLQLLPGKEQDAVAGLTELAPIITKLRARVTARTITVGGPATGQVALVVECDDLAMFGSVADRLPASAGYQAWLAKYRAATTIVGRAVVVQVL